MHPHKMSTNIFQQKIMGLALSKLYHNICFLSSKVKAIIMQDPSENDGAAVIFKINKPHKCPVDSMNSGCFQVPHYNVLKHLRAPSSLYLLFSTHFQHQY